MSKIHEISKTTTAGDALSTKRPDLSSTEHSRPPTAQSATRMRNRSISVCKAAEGGLAGLRCRWAQQRRLDWVGRYPDTGNSISPAISWTIVVCHDHSQRSPNQRSWERTSVVLQSSHCSAVPVGDMLECLVCVRFVCTGRRCRVGRDCVYKVISDSYGRQDELSTDVSLGLQTLF